MPDYRPASAAIDTAPATPVRRFIGQCALVTGASGSVGGAIALALAREGARTWIVGRRAPALRALAASMPEDAPRAVCVETDLASDADLTTLVRGMDQERPGLDILVHSAGTITLGAVEETGIDAFDEQYRTNLRAPYMLTQALLPMLRRQQGQIVFINSSMGLAVKPNVSQYAATKHGLKALADGVREEVNADGVRVLSVFLGRTAGSMQRAVHEYEQRQYHSDVLIQPDDVASVVLGALALPRTAEITDITLRPHRKLDAGSKATA